MTSAVKKKKNDIDDSNVGRNCVKLIFKYYYNIKMHKFYLVPILKLEGCDGVITKESKQTKIIKCEILIIPTSLKKE